MKKLIICMLLMCSAVYGNYTISDTNIMTGVKFSGVAAPASAFTFDIPTQTITAYDGSLGTQASFKAYYEAGGSLAGTYEYIADAWSKTH
jgi:hypothetical protein